MNDEQLQDILGDAVWTSNHVGSTGSKVRERAANTVRLVQEYRRLVRGRAATPPDELSRLVDDLITERVALRAALADVQARCTAQQNEIRRLRDGE